ncbi:glycosyltransferase family 2 protein [Candidatus Bipolaricaulota bacterium]
MLSIIIVSWNIEKRLRNCLLSLANRMITSYEIIVVDNASTDRTVEMMRQEFSWIRLLANEENLGFASACNQGIMATKGEFLLLLNPDVVVPRAALEGALEVFRSTHNLGMLGCRLVDENGETQRSIFPFPTPMWDLFCAAGAVRLLRTVRGKLPNGILKVKGYLTGAFLLVRRKAVEDVGILDGSIFMYGEDVEWCYRFHQAGWDIGYYPKVAIVHIGNQSGKKAFGDGRLELVYRGIMYFQKKHFPHYYMIGSVIRAGSLMWKMMVMCPLDYLFPKIGKAQEYRDAFVANFRAMLKG